MYEAAEKRSNTVLDFMSYLTRQKFAVPLDRDQVAHDWRRRGYACDMFTDPPGRESI